MLKLRYWLPGMVALGAVAACAGGPGEDEDGDDEVISYDHFAMRAARHPDRDVWIVNGDEIASSEEELRAAYEAYRESARRARLAEQGLAEQDSSLAVNRVGGQDDKWTQAQAQTLTYCIARSSMDTQARYDTTVAAMASATAAWEQVAAVNFVHASQHDGNCTTSTPVTFNVRRMFSFGAFIAAAFFPSDARGIRELDIDIGAYGNIAPFTLTGALRHELGHAIGFRHEHTRPEGAADCFEDNDWRELTAYDAASVMHYPQCGGTNTGDLALTALDRTGAGALYPRGGFPQLNNAANDPDAAFALNQSLVFTGTSTTTGAQGPWMPVTGSSHSLNRGSAGNVTLTFTAAWDHSTGPSQMRLDAQFFIDGVAVGASQRFNSRGNISFTRTVAIGTGNHDVWVEVRSVLAGGPPIAIALTGAPAVVNATW